MMTIMIMLIVMTITVELAHTSVSQSYLMSYFEVVRAELLAEVDKKGESMAAKLDQVQRCREWVFDFLFSFHR